jgi:hypothetical protein
MGTGIVMFIYIYYLYQTNQQQALLPIHSCAQSMIQLAKISRQHGHIETALDCLNK